MSKEFAKYFRGNIDVIHPIACGIDVHSKFLVAVICIHTDPTKDPKYFKKRFSLFTGDLRCLLEWLKSFNCYYVCMESTGVYWCPVYRVQFKYTAAKSEDKVFHSSFFLEYRDPSLTPQFY